jgi:putative salt-induced outer membrane protein
MKRVRQIIAAAGMFAAWSGAAAAQTNFVTVTNYVTVTITNVVTVTNTVKPVAATAESVANAASAAMAPAKTNQWNHSISAGLTLVRGDTDITLVSGDFQTSKKTSKDEYAATVGAAFGEQNSKQTVDNYKGSAQWNHLFTPHFYDYVRGDGLRDYIADVDYRVTGGPGLGYYLLKSTNTTLAVESGFNYEDQSLGGVENSFATIRLADKFERKINNRARVWESLEVFPQIDDFANYVVNCELGVETSLTKSFSLKTCLDDGYNNHPAANHVKNDVKLVAGVAFKF